MDNIEKLKKWVEESNNIVFFGGAGVSTESGIPDFRGEKGIYQTISEYGINPETILSHTFFENNKEVFFDYCKKHLIFLDAKPNAAHYALAELEKQGKLKAVITQNIDNLHQEAGSKNVLELHGTLYKNYCIKCGKKFDINYVLNSKGVPKCDKCGGVVRPDVVLYEESLDMGVMQKAVNYIASCDMLIIGGTSLAVYPAAGLINYYNGNKLVLINKSTTNLDNRADLALHMNIGEVFSKIM